MKSKKEKKKSKKKLSDDFLLTLDIKEPSTIHNKTLTVVNNTRLKELPTELPENFFEEIIDEEMELSEEFTMDKFLSLVRKYSAAIEYYIVLDSNKAKLYQNRMEYLLTNKDTLIQLKKQKNGDLIEPKNEKEKNINMKRKKAIQTVKMKTEDLKFDDLSEKVNKVISLNSGDKEIVKNIIDDDIQKQNENWKEKLLSKKKSKTGLNSTFNKKRKESNSSISDSPVISQKNSEEIKISAFNELYNNEKENLDENLGKIEEKEEENMEEIKKNENKNVEDHKEEIKDNENKIIENEKTENEKSENKIVENQIKENEKKEDINIRQSNAQPRKNVVEEDVIRPINVDDGVLSSVNDKIKFLEKLVKNINISDNNSENDDQSDGDENIKENDNNKITLNKEKVPIKFQGAYDEVVQMMKNYMNKVNKFYYKNIFYMFSSELKELYELKCNKYIEIRNEYHQQIIEKEYLLQNEENLNEEKKQEIQQTIDSLKEEQQHQIATIEDEFNRKILAKVTEFKLNSFKKDSGIQLIEEQLKLDVYSVINDSFY